MKKSKTKLIIAIIAIVLVIAIGLTIFLVLNKKSEAGGGDTSVLAVDMNGVYWLAADGKDVDLVELFGCDDDATFASTSSGITITGSTAIITSEGEKEVSITIDGDTDNVTIIACENGVNVSNSVELYAAANDEEDIFVTMDIDLVDGTVMLYSNLYGNGKQIYCLGAYVNDEIHSSIAFEIQGEDILIQDGYFIGLKPDKEDFDLTVFEKSGRIFNLYGAEDLGFKPGATFKNCIIENSHVGIRAENANVTINGTILRNASDACLSIGTTNKGPSIINIKNTVMANAVVATICNWCTENNIKSENYVVFNFEGFFDAYNWKNDKTVKLIPGTEGSVAGIGNSIIAGEVKKSEYDKYAFVYKDGGERWLNVAMLAISTGDTDNKPVLNRLADVNMESNAFPLPKAATNLNILKNAILIGYTTNTIDDVDVKPNKLMTDNENLYKDLRDGRN